MKHESSSHEAMKRAALHAIAYRRATAEAVRTPTSGYGDMLAAFGGPTPEKGGDPVQIIDELADLATPGIRASTGPRFFGWVIGNSHPTGVAADWLTSAWGQNGGNLLAAPAASAVEAVAAGWLLDLLRLPPDASVGLVTGATVANFVCLAAARSEMLRRVGWDVEADGLFGAPPIDVLIGADAHATVFSALKYLGLGARRVITVASDDAGRMRADALELALGTTAGPKIVITQAGQINTGACDPFETIVPIAKAAGAWVHVDGAFGLWAQACPERAALTAGVEQADSWATDGHKWLQTPYDCGYAIVRHAEAHRRAMAISASYLPPAEGAERDPSAYVPELSRRARGFATWAMIRQLGRIGIADMVERHCRIARHMAEAIAAAPGAVLICAVELNQFMIRFGGPGKRGDTATLDTVAAIQADAIAFIGAAQWRGEWVMRVSVTSIATTMADADQTAAAVLAAWAAVRNAQAASVDNTQRVLTPCLARLDIPEADVSFLDHIPFHLPDEAIFDALLRDTKWLHEEVVVYGERHMQPRLTAWYGDAGKSYSYSGVTMRPLPWTELLMSLRRELEQLTGACFNSVLLNLYRDQNDRMGIHSDNESSLGDQPMIASLSYGATRTLIFKHKARDHRDRKVALTSGSLLVMRGLTQTFWRHGVNRESRSIGPRINLTFRWIVD